MKNNVDNLEFKLITIWEFNNLIKYHTRTQLALYAQPILCSLSLVILNQFIEVWLHRESCPYLTYNLMSLEISIYSWNYPHNLYHKHIQKKKKNPSPPTISSCALYLLFFVIRTLNIIPKFLANFKVYYSVVNNF